MKKLIYFFIFIMLLSGCASVTIDSELTEANQKNLSKLSIGMSKRQVSKVMVDKVYHFGGLDLTPVGLFVHPTSTIKNPYKSEMLQGKDGKTFEVRYYLTRTTDARGKSKKAYDNKLTPLVFEDGKLIGWGWDFLNNSKPTPP